MNLPELLQAIRARMESAKGYALDDPRTRTFSINAYNDLAKLLAIVELQRAVLESVEASHCYGCSDDAREAIQACDKLAGGE